MKDIIINDELSINIPEKFEVYQKNELKKIYQSSSDNMWGAKSEDGEFILSVLWKDGNRLLVMLADLKSAVLRNETETKKVYTGNDFSYDLMGFFSTEANNIKAEGYRFTFAKDSKKKIMTTALIKHKSRIYTLNCMGPSESSSKADDLFSKTLATLKLS